MILPRRLKNSSVLCGVVCMGCVLLLWHFQHTTIPDRMNSGQHEANVITPLQKPVYTYRNNPVLRKNTTRFLDTDVVYTYLEWKKRQGSDLNIDHEMVNYHLKEMRVLMNNTKHRYPGDGMPEQCATKDYGDLSELPKATIYFTFHNSEELLNIVHTLHSIFQNSPHQLIHEIILIDDNSVKEELKGLLQNYVDAVFGRHVANIRVIRSQRQLGLIRGRLLAARLAEGEVIISMDSHMELRPGWLESLLYEIKRNRRTLASSCLDWMKPQADGSWVYEHGGNVFRGVFDWDMAFGYYNRPMPKDLNPTEPLLIPMIVGTIFAIERTFFFEIGGFDEGMEAWGGENIDLSLRVFMCGGQVISVPCSHAAHMEAPGQRDYRSGWDKVIQRNYNRVVQSLFGPFKKYFYIFKPSAKGIDAGDVSDRIASIERCPGNFSSYLDNFYPEMGNPEVDGLAYGRVKNKKTGHCIDRNILNQGKVYVCHDSGTPQILIWTTQGYLRTGLALLDVSGDNAKRISQPAATSLLDPDFEGTRWIHWKNGLIIAEKSQKCLQASAKGALIVDAVCDAANPFQQWTFDTYTDLYDAFLRGDFKEKSILSSPEAGRRFQEKVTATLRKYNVLQR